MTNIEKALPEAAKKHGQQEAAAYIGARYSRDDNGAPVFSLVEMAENGQRPTARRKA